MGEVAIKARDLNLASVDGYGVILNARGLDAEFERCWA
jgi:hypothetical protein